MKTPILLLLLFLIFVFLISSSNGHGEWEILTEQNFSSQIHIHPHVLLLVTTPWCGESRSLKNEITRLVQSREEFGLLKLMILYSNSEKVLAQAIGAANGLTILYYHNSVPYNYLGKLRASNIVSSIHPYLTSTPQELPLKHLKSPKSLNDFLESSDKSLVLFEFCGWTATLLSELKKNVTEDNLWQGNFSKKVEKDKVLKLSGKNKQKVADYAVWTNMCGLQSGFGRVPWLEDFSYVNDTAALQENSRVNPNFGQTCNHEQFKQFSSFLSKLIATTKEFSLPPERQKFGLITEKSLASLFNIGESDSWAAAVQLAGCPHCSKILKADDNILKFLQMENPIVTELDDNWQDHGSFFPANKPSVILFVDRSSGSLEDRRRSVQTLDNFREVAAQHKSSDIKNWKDDIKYENTVSQADQESKSVSLPKSVQTFKTIKLENKVSFMILDGDKHVALDTIAPGMEGSSLQDILANLVHRRKASKLSVIAKDVGFRLLSDDLNIKVMDALPSQAEVISGQDTSSLVEGHSETSLPPKEGDVQNRVSMSSEEKDEIKSFETESSSPSDEEQISTNRSEQLVMTDTDKTEVYLTDNVRGDINASSHSESKEDPVLSFTGSFFFSDANYALLRALTGDVKIPSAVIIDPALQQHYVLQDELAFSYSSLNEFLHGYLNGSLSPYTQSESTIQMPRKATVPPFVNLDFHEVDAIPRVTVNTFSHMVHAWNQSSAEKAPCPLCQDVLVIFSNNWCGFCQRMELVVREIYRLLKEYEAKIQEGSTNNQRLLKSETPINGKKLKSPLIYLMDCTLNDCSLILKSLNQTEVYPSLILFPAERNKVIPYKGETSFTYIIEFLSRHANNSREFFTGILPTLSGKGRRNSDKFDQSSSAVSNKVTDGDKLVEVVLRNRESAEREVNHDQVTSQSPPTHSLATAPEIKTGTILVATEKLATSQPFAKSKILIIKAGPEFGFLGLIFNKQLRWKSFPDLGETAELLKETPLYFGGPVVDPGIPLLALTRERDSSPNHIHQEISPGVYFLDHESVARRMEELKTRDLNPSDYWFFLGYSSWSYDQLFDEISLGVWDVDNSNIDFAWP